MSNVCVVGIEESEEPTAALDAADAQGEIDLDTACMVLRWYELRRRIERFFHVLKIGSRLELAGDLRKCLPFDAITSFRVWDIPNLARARRDDPTGRRVSGDDIRALCALASRYGFKVPGGPPEMTIAGFVVLTGCLAGLLPSKRQSLPGTQKLWEGIRLLSLAVTAIHAMQEWNRKSRKEMNPQNRFSLIWRLVPVDGGHCIVKDLGAFGRSRIVRRHDLPQQGGNEAWAMACKRHVTQSGKFVINPFRADFGNFPHHSGLGLNVLGKRDRMHRHIATRQFLTTVEIEARLPLGHELARVPVSESHLIRVPDLFPCCVFAERGGRVCEGRVVAGREPGWHAKALLPELDFRFHPVAGETGYPCRGAHRDGQTQKMGK